MADPFSASVFCFTPLRVPVSELGRLNACPQSQPLPTAPNGSALSVSELGQLDACPPSQPSPIAPDCSALSVSELGQLDACPLSQPSPTAPVCLAPPLPVGPCPVCPRLDQDFEAFRLAAYYKAQHARSVEREAQLKVEIDRLKELLSVPVRHFAHPLWVLRSEMFRPVDSVKDHLDVLGGRHGGCR